MARKPRPAAGIPDRGVYGQVPPRTEPSGLWSFILQRHDAARAGVHQDLRLLDPETGRAYSFALPEGLPEPGRVAKAVEQPIHSADAFTIRRIPSGYGKGTYQVLRKGLAQIREASPGKVHFSIYDQREPEDFALVTQKPGPGGKSGLILNNITPTRSRPDGKLLPLFKPDYREVPFHAVDPTAPHEIVSAKIDGAHVLYQLKPGKFIRVFSYRDPKRKGKTGLIEHTHKVQALYGQRAPDWIPRQGVVLRGELYARDPQTAKPTEAQLIGGMLNAMPPGSLERQGRYGQLRPVVFDVHRWGSVRQDVKGKPYIVRHRLLRKLQKAVPSLELPDFAVTPSQKRKLVDRIAQGQHPQTREGVVIWGLKQDRPPTKAKITQDFDLPVVGFTPGRGRHAGKGIGAFVVQDPATGARTRVGTGLSDTMRVDAHLHPERYLGMVATLTAEKRYQSGKLSKPRLLRWHLDKNPPEKLRGAKLTPREKQAQQDEVLLGELLGDGLQKTAIAWGGRRKEWPGKQSKTPVRLSAGYSNMLGVAPFPYVGVRLGSGEGLGVRTGYPLHIGLDSGASDSLRTRHRPRGLLDFLVEALENASKKKGRKKGKGR